MKRVDPVEQLEHALPHRLVQLLNLTDQLLEAEKKVINVGGHSTVSLARPMHKPQGWMTAFAP